VAWISIRPVVEEIRKDLFLLVLGGIIGSYFGYSVASQYQATRYENKVQRIYTNIIESDERKLKSIETLINSYKPNE